MEGHNGPQRYRFCSSWQWPEFTRDSGVRLNCGSEDAENVMNDQGGNIDRAMPYEAFADLHNHVIPGVDDGSRSLEESVEALEEFAAAGVRYLVATPHLYLQALDGEAMLAQRLDQLEGAFQQMAEAVPEGLNVPELKFGQEVYAPEGSSIRRVVEDPRVGLGGTDFMLVEFGFELQGDPDEVIETVHAAGRKIVVAHPERYFFPNDIDPMATMRRWRDAGALLQVNLGSLDEADSAYGSEAERLGWQLIEEGLAHLVSSDHHCRSRPQILHQEIHAAISVRGGAEQADLLLRENPLRIFQGVDPLPVPGLYETTAAAARAGR